MARMSPKEFEQRVSVWLSDLSSHFEKIAPGIFARWARSAVGRYMRDAKSEIGTRRAEDDTGPLRILSGTLAGAVGAGGPNRPGVVQRVRAEGLRTVFEKGVDLDAVPYARIHEKGGVAGRGAVIPARSYIQPALQDEKAAIARIAQRGLRESFRQEVLRA